MQHHRARPHRREDTPGITRPALVAGGAVARPPKTKHIEPTWPDHSPNKHAVTELVATHQGNLSPFGDLTFPLPSTPYRHPVTVINK